MNILLSTFRISNVAFVFFFFKKQNYGMFTFVHMITTMAESGSTEEQTEFFILNSQKGAKASWWRNCFARLSNHLQEHCGEVGTTEAGFPMHMEFDPISFETALHVQLLLSQLICELTICLFNQILSHQTGRPVQLICIQFCFSGWNLVSWNWTQRAEAMISGAENSILRNSTFNSMVVCIMEKKCL